MMSLVGWQYVRVNSQQPASIGISPADLCLGHVLNWEAVGPCFISRTWRIQSASMFAGTCTAVVRFTIAHEGFRFLGKFYDRWAIETFGDGNGECCRPCLSIQLVRAGIFMLQAITGYFLMLFVFLTPRTSLAEMGMLMGA
jgi:hypothetical protein